MARNLLKGPFLFFKFLWGAVGIGRRSSTNLRNFRGIGKGGTGEIISTLGTRGLPQSPSGIHA
jgi:hypothetical protein